MSSQQSSRPGSQQQSQGSSHRGPGDSPQAPEPGHSYRYYDLVMAGFVAVLVCANIIGAPKVAMVFGLVFGAGNLFFPFSYLFGDILTEVYGYARARRAVWAGFSALIFAAIMSGVIVALPPAEHWQDQAAFETAFGMTWRIAVASFLGYWAGEFVNAYVMAKMKIATSGRWLWSRTIASTVAGQAVDSIIFYPLAFYGVWDERLFVPVMLTNYVVKVGWEALMTPLTYGAVGFLKRAEGQDHFDLDTNFTPFSLEKD